MFVKSELEKLGYTDCNVKLGEVVCSNNLSTNHLDHLKEVLHDAGLDILDDKKSILI
jgi:hypothetical protein